MSYLARIAKILKCEPKHVKFDVFYTKSCQSNRLFVLKLKGIEVSRFNLTQLHGCCGICLSYHAQVSKEFRGKGLGTLLNKMRQQIAVNLGYSVILCTDVADNKPQSKILMNNAWKKLLTFKNRRTEHMVNISAKKLRKGSKILGFDLSPKLKRIHGG